MDQSPCAVKVLDFHREARLDVGQGRCALLDEFGQDRRHGRIFKALESKPSGGGSPGSFQGQFWRLDRPLRRKQRQRPKKSFLWNLGSCTMMETDIAEHKEIAHAHP